MCLSCPTISRVIPSLFFVSKFAESTTQMGYLKDFTHGWVSDGGDSGDEDGDNNDNDSGSQVFKC